MRVTRTRPDPRGVPQSTNGSAQTASGRVLAFPVILFMISLVLPFFLHIGPLLMSVNRLVLAAMVVPCSVIWMRGRAGPVRTADIALLLMCAWILISFLVVEGPGVAIEASGIRFIETIGAFLLARCFIRDASSFRAIVLVLFRIIAIMLPFALYETLTGHNVLLEFANRFWPAGGDVWKEPRWGLDRVQGVFQHPILFGVFCGSATALVYYVLGYKASGITRSFKTALVAGGVLLSFSSGPLTALIVQLSLIGWDRLLSSVRRRWAILTGGVLSMVVALELAANRSTPELFISYFAFDKWTASNRLRIWDYGSLSVANHPFFGIGRNEWERPYWMSSSMDMFWLVSAVRNGLPAALLLQLAFFSLFLSVAFKSGLTDRVARYRTGYLICMLGLYLGGWTVDYWKTIYVLFIFLLGSGAWILDAGGEPDEVAEEDRTGSDHRARPLHNRPRQALEPTYTRRGSAAHNRQKA